MSITAASVGLPSELIVRFMTEQTFFYGVWTQLRTQWKDNKDFPFVAGVCHTTRGFTLLLNREKWAELDDDSKIFNHVLVNISMDLIINEHFAVYKDCKIAKEGMWLSRFPKLPQNVRDLDWRTIYDKLMEEAEKNQQQGQSFDDHSFESDGDGEGQAKPGGGAGDTLSNADLADLAKAQAEEIARNAARHCQIRGQGDSIPQQIKVMIEKPLKPHIQLVRELLQRFVQSSRDTKKRLTWKRFSRRLGPIARGRMSAKRPCVAVAVDSSGSMTGQETVDLIAQAIAAVCAVAEDVNCVVGDTEVRASGKLTPANISVEFPRIMQGGGGTTLQPLLNHLAESGRYDAVILLTDGYCESLEAQQPTVALIVPGGQDAPGVKSVHLQAQK
jgi:predicted metal-dependent peptidase